MLINFFFALRAGGLKVGLTEFLALLQALDQRLIGADLDEFYCLSRGLLVQDETQFDRFDRVFAEYVHGIQTLLAGEEGAAEIPEEWLRREAERLLSPEEMARIKGLGGLDAIMEALRQRLAEQKERHQGGSKWIGTGGTSPFGAYGYNPEGVRIGQHESRHRRAVKVWDRREFRNLDDSLELGTRNMKLALRRLRRFARTGAAEILDLDETIGATAKNAGYLDLKMVPERHNAVKVLLFLDVGGSMDDHVRVCEELFSAARAEFKHLEHFYFHNIIYEGVWRDSRRRHTERLPTEEVLRTYGPDYKLILVGDAAMSPYEIVAPGGSVEHWNEEPGEVWLKRLLGTYAKAIWLNPEPQDTWPYTASIGMTRQLMDDRMFPLTLDGLERGIAQLSRGT